MSTTVPTASTTTAARTTTPQRVGCGLALLLGLANLASVAFPTPEGEVGPPLGILLLGSVLGLVIVVGAVLGWRGSALARRVTAGTLVLVTLTSVPAFFVDVPLAVKAFVAVTCLLAVATVVLLFSGRSARP